ncbi:MAG: hypothetical protein ACKOEH_12000, partial [Actinomycetota bacterium]
MILEQPHDFSGKLCESLLGSVDRAARGTTITLMVQKRALDFDLRRTLQPTKAMVLPRRTIDRPEKRLAQLAAEIVGLFKNQDANELVRPEIGIAKD